MDNALAALDAFEIGTVDVDDLDLTPPVCVERAPVESDGGPLV